MNTTSIRTDDIVRCDVRGDLFYGLVVRPLEYDETMKKKVVKIVSLTGRPIPTMFVTGFQIKDHWKKRGRKRKEKS
jgi:hypothetical protein